MWKRNEKTTHSDQPSSAEDHDDDDDETVDEPPLSPSSSQPPILIPRDQDRSDQSRRTVSREESKRAASEVLDKKAKRQDGTPHRPGAHPSTAATRQGDDDCDIVEDGDSSIVEVSYSPRRGRVEEDVESFISRKAQSMGGGSSANANRANKAETLRNYLPDISDDEDEAEDSGTTSDGRNMQSRPQYSTEWVPHVVAMPVEEEEERLGWRRNPFKDWRVMLCLMVAVSAIVGLTVALVMNDDGNEVKGSTNDATDGQNSGGGDNSAGVGKVEFDPFRVELETSSPLNALERAKAVDVTEKHLRDRLRASLNAFRSLESSATFEEIDTRKRRLEVRRRESSYTATFNGSIEFNGEAPGDAVVAAAIIDAFSTGTNMNGLFQSMVEEGLSSLTSLALTDESGNILGTTLTAAPTHKSTDSPTPALISSSGDPTLSPTPAPSKIPTDSPVTSAPTNSPTTSPTPAYSSSVPASPTRSPISLSSNEPSTTPSSNPTARPSSKVPTQSPTVFVSAPPPTHVPTTSPTVVGIASVDLDPFHVEFETSSPLDSEERLNAVNSIVAHMNDQLKASLYGVRTLRLSATVDEKGRQKRSLELRRRLEALSYVASFDGSIEFNGEAPEPGEVRSAIADAFSTGNNMDSLLQSILDEGLSVTHVVVKDESGIILGMTSTTAPTHQPTESPTPAHVSSVPSEVPTYAPTKSPTDAPSTATPTESPTASPAPLPRVLTTELTTGGAAKSKAGAMFDVIASGGASITITSMDVHIDLFDSDIEVELWTRPGSFVGNGDSSAGWTLRNGGQTYVISTGLGEGTLTPIPEDQFEPIVLAADETIGLYVTVTSGNNVTVTSGNKGIIMGQGTDNVFADDFVTISDGMGVAYQFGTSFSPRIFNGAVRYILTPP